MFSKAVLASFAILSLGVSVASVWAQSAAAVVSKDDTDKDMTLNLAEVKTAASAHFDKLNKDGDTHWKRPRSRV